MGVKLLLYLGNAFAGEKVFNPGAPDFTAPHTACIPPIAGPPLSFVSRNTLFMRFTDVIGQQAVTRHLARLVQEDRAPHALLLLGPPGAGGLTLAFAYAQYLLCEDRQASDSCGVCVAGS